MTIDAVRNVTSRASVFATQLRPDRVTSAVAGARVTTRVPRRLGSHQVLKVTRWCIAHRRRVFVAWIAVAVVTTVVARRPGATTRTNFSLPGTESQRALDLLKREFPAQSGDVDTIVFHTANGTVDVPRCAAAIDELLTQGEPATRTWSACSARTAPRGAVRDLARPPDRVRDDQLRQAGQPGAERHRQAGARSDRRRPRARPEGGRRRPGDRERRGLQHRPGDPDRRDRRAGHPADHVRFAASPPACR